MSNTTTIARGFHLTRKDGHELAFTDCDVDLVVGGATYRAASALDASEATQALGTAVDEMDITGGLSSEAISESDLSSGLYDGAQIEVIEIDFSTETRLETVGVYMLGEVSRGPAAFTAELRSIVGLLGQTRGRYITAACDAELGDQHCKLDITGLAGSGQVSSVLEPTELRVSFLSGFSEDAFNSGSLVWTSGVNLGQSHEVRICSETQVSLWRAPLFDVSPGDSFDILPGCDQSYETCKNRFDNTPNFQGFPHVAGADALTYAVPGEAGLDGGSRNG